MGKQKSIKEIIKEVAKKNNWNYNTTKTVWDAIITTVIISNLNKQPVRLQPIGNYEIKQRKSKKLDNYFGEIEIPSREVLKFVDSQLYKKTFERKDFYSFAMQGEGFSDIILVIDKETKHIKDGGTSWECLMELMRINWTNFIIFICKNEEEVLKFQQKLQNIDEIMREVDKKDVWIFERMKKAFENEKIIILKEEQKNE